MHHYQISLVKTLANYIIKQQKTGVSGVFHTRKTFVSFAPLFLVLFVPSFPFPNI